MVLASFAWPRRRALPHGTILWLFAAFVLTCGLSHLLEAVTFHTPVYRLSGLVKLATALLSWATVVALVPVAKAVVHQEWTAAPLPVVNDAAAARPVWRNPYVVAVAAVVLATVTRLSLSPLLDQQAPFLTYLLAAVVVAWYGGFGPSLLAVVLGGVCAWFLFLGTFGAWEIEGLDEVLWLSLYLFVGVFTGLMAESLRVARQHAEASTLELLDQRRTLEQEVIRREQAQADLVRLNTTLEERVAERTAAAEAERRLLDAVLDALPVAVIIAEADGRLVRLNRACERVWGPAPRSGSIAEYGEWVGYWPETKVRIKPEEWAMSRALLKGEVCPGELIEVERFGDRSRRFVLNSGSPVRGPEGAIVAGVVASMDVTDRVAAETALRESRALFEALFEAAPDAVIAVNEQGRVVRVNRQTEQLFGYPREEVTGQTVEVFLPERFLARHVELRNDFLANPTVRSLGTLSDLWGRRKDGSEFPVDITLGPAQSGDGTIVLGTVRDVTERRRAEEALRAGEQQYRDLAEALPQLVWVTRPDGWHFYFNRRWFEFTGMTPEASYGFGWSNQLHPDDRDRCLKRWNEAVVSGEPYEIEYRFRGAGGAYRWFLGRALPLRNQRGEIDRWFGTCTDIEDSKRAEEKLRGAAEALARSNAELEQFAYVASHDLQEPLRMVGSYLELLAKRYKGHLDERADRYIHYAVDGATRMQALIQDLLAYSRVTTKARSPEPIDSGAALRAALRNLQKAVEEAGAEVTFDSLPMVCADATQLTQVFQNLIGNALKFCEVKPPRVHIGCDRRGPEWVFSIRDNGIGIAPEHAERIFLIFQRLHSRDKYSGTGIGLAVCKKVAERHGGRIWVESQPGQGSTFYFTLTTEGKGHHDHGNADGATG